VGLRATFSGSLIFNQLFDISHPPVAAWYAYVPVQLGWMQAVPMWAYLLNLTIGMTIVVVAYLRAPRRRLTLTLRRKTSRAVRSLLANQMMPSWLFP
jgi:hypothetical protein